MKSLLLGIVACVASASAAEPFGYSIRLAEGVLSDADALCVGVQFEVRDVYAVVFSDLPSGWYAQVLKEDDQISFRIGIWGKDGGAPDAEVRAKAAVPASEMLKCIWIQALPVDFAENEEPKPKALSISGEMGMLGEPRDTILPSESIVPQFGVIEAPSWSTRSPGEERVEEPRAMENPEDEQRVLVD